MAICGHLGGIREPFGDVLVEGQPLEFEEPQRV